MHFTVCIENVCDWVFMQIRFSTSMLGFQQPTNSFPLLHSVPLHFAKFTFSEILCFANTPPFWGRNSQSFSARAPPVVTPSDPRWFPCDVSKPTKSYCLRTSMNIKPQEFFMYPYSAGPIITGIRLPKMPRDFRIVIQSVIKHTLCSDVKFSFIILLSFACIM